MKKIILFTVMASVLGCSGRVWPDKDADILVLSLQQKIDDKAISTIELFTNDVDPNTASVNDNFSMEINGKEVKVPMSIMRSLDHERRGYSYDSFTGGIESLNVGVMCMMGGSAAGSILYVRYLTYKNHQIEYHEMKPVYSQGDNCLFTQMYAPVKLDAQKSAVKAMAILDTIRVLSSN